MRRCENLGFTEKISSLKQGDRLKIPWDELMNLRPMPTCMCISQCSCNAFEIITGILEFALGSRDGSHDGHQQNQSQNKKFFH